MMKTPRTSRAVFAAPVAPKGNAFIGDVQHLSVTVEVFEYKRSRYAARVVGGSMLPTKTAHTVVTARARAARLFKLQLTEWSDLQREAEPEPQTEPENLRLF